MKLCVDCKYCDFGAVSAAVCTHPNFSPPEPVHGSRTFPTAKSVRYSEGCGLEAKLFEPKVSFWKKIFG